MRVTWTAGIALALAFTAGPAGAQGSCVYEDAIIVYADAILANRAEGGRFGARRYGARSVYLKILYQDLREAEARAILASLRADRVREAEEIEHTYLLTRHGVAGLDMIGPDRARAFAGLSGFGWRALILADGGETFLDLVAQQKAAAEPDRMFPMRYNQGVGPAVWLIDQDDAFKTRFADLAEARGEPVLAAAVLATKSTLDDYAALLVRHAGDSSVTDFASSRFLSSFGLTGYHGTGPYPDELTMEADRRDFRIGLHDMFRAMFLAREIDYLAIFMNQTGREQEVIEVARRYIAEVEAGRIDPFRDSEAAWAFQYAALVDVMPRDEVDRALSSFDIASTRHYVGRARDVVDWAIAVTTITPLVRGEGAAPPRPVLLSDTVDWTIWMNTAQTVRDGGMPAVGDDYANRVAVEILYRAGRVDDLSAFAKQAFEPKHWLKIHQDVMGRMDADCAGYMVYPGQSLYLGGAPAFHFTAAPQLPAVAGQGTVPSGDRPRGRTRERPRR